MKLFEGGNVVPNAVQLEKANFSAVMDNLRKLLPPNMQLYPIGSAGKKEISSDIDVLVDAKELMTAFPTKELKLSRKALEDYFHSKGLFAARTGVSIHVGIPIGNTNNVVQVDIMAVENAAAAQPLHTHDYSDPALKGGTLHGMWADLANMSQLPGHASLMMSPYKGLVDRETKELVTNDKDQIAKIIIGPTANAKDMGNPTLMMKALEQYPEKYKAIKDKYFSESVTEGSTEWFRKALEILK
jgi:predicted nucleotidyltransferase